MQIAVALLAFQSGMPTELVWMLFWLALAAILVFLMVKRPGNFGHSVFLIIAIIAVLLVAFVPIEIRLLFWMLEKMGLS